jgi:hypothetical protein
MAFIDGFLNPGAPVLSLALLLSCGGKPMATMAAAPPDANGMVGSSDLGLPPEAPSPKGDGRLVDIPDSPQGTGWDTCDAQPPLMPGPIAGTAGPEATRGSRYLVAGPDRTTDGSVGVHTPQAYLWLEKAGTANGLWLDLVQISGTAAQSQVSIFRTDSQCNVERTLATANLHSLVVAGAWRTICLDLGSAGVFTHLGIRLDSPQGRIALDALRLGPPCPR